jgi:hypothetical protein
MKSKQFCSVCKEWLEMEVVPTGDGEDDDGVVWFRCPQCQGFLPKLKGSDPAARAAPSGGAAADPAPEPDPAGAVAAGDQTADADEAVPDDAGAGDEPGAAGDAEDDLPWDSPADMMASRALEEDIDGGAEPGAASGEEEPAAGDAAGPEEGEGEPAETVADYAAMLAEADQGDPKPYRPWDTYEVGDCIMHLAWEDCGVVVAKEDLPGGRRVIKCYFGEAGVVRLIENAPR